MFFGYVAIGHGDDALPHLRTDVFIENKHKTKWQELPTVGNEATGRSREILKRV